MHQFNQWLVVMTKPRMEKKAKEQLEQQNFQVYLPYWIDLKLKNRKWQQVIQPMFPRYLFFRPTHTNQSLSSIRSTIGVSQLLRFGSEPALASHNLIDEIKKIEQLQKNSAVELKPFEKGDEVQLIDGPFKGNFAEVLSSNQDRVTLLLKVLGTTHQLDFKSEFCQPS